MVPSTFNSDWLATATGAVLVLACGLSAPAADTAAARVETNLQALGRVRLDKEHRAVRFPAAVNQRSGVVEYAVVHTTGKTHESVFRTEARPQEIHVAMLLLGVKPANTSSFPADFSTPPPGEPVTLDVSWRGVRGEVRRPLEEFVVATNTMRSPAAGVWIYNGSWVADGKFAAQREGSIISTHVDPDALVNNSWPGRENDDLYQVNTTALPPDGVPVEVTIRLPPRKPQ
ncbi:MAG TPA: YdjY domain-containing protein [Verrucomicrobiae bacterium]|jgi:hypothetical protein